MNETTAKFPSPCEDVMFLSHQVIWTKFILFPSPCEDVMFPSASKPWKSSNCFRPLARM